jgi:tRNA(Ile)-lysidine synthase
MDLQITIPVGTYIVAVSGGVDSVVLLHLLSKTDCKLVVAHFDHGIRHNSHDDAAFVKSLAASYGLAYEEEKANLGPSASEDTARKARYAFLRRVTNTYHAKAIATAHHQDDVIETSIINILRGTGRNMLNKKSTLYRPRKPLEQNSVFFRFLFYCLT